MKNKKGFTLVEMLIVVVIIGILAAALIPRLVGAQSQARDVARKKGMSDIKSAVEIYYNETGIYPGSNWGGGTYDTVCANYLIEFLSGAISSIPSDPQKNHQNFGKSILGNTVNTDSTAKNYCLGQYNYIPLNNKGKANGLYAQGSGAYAIYASMENLKNNNLVIFTYSRPLPTLNRNYSVIRSDFSKSLYQSFLCEGNIRISGNSSTYPPQRYNNGDLIVDVNSPNQSVQRKLSDGYPLCDSIDRESVTNVQFSND